MVLGKLIQPLKMTTSKSKPGICCWSPISGTLAADTLVGDLVVANLSGIVDPANLGTGTADASTFLRGTILYCC